MLNFLQSQPVTTNQPTSGQQLPQHVLDSLRDVIPPESVGLWPIANIWWWFLGLLVVIALERLINYILHRPHRQAQALLNLIAKEQKSVTNNAPTAAAISLVLRRFCLYAWPDATTFEGDEWLGFLDHTGGRGKFRTHLGKHLTESAFKRSVNFDVQELVSVCAQWIKAQPVRIRKRGKTTKVAVVNSSVRKLLSGKA